MTRKTECHPERNHEAKGLCAPCYKETHRQANIERYRERARNYYWRHRDQIMARSKHYKKPSVEEQRDYQKSYHEKHKSDPDYILARSLRNRLYKAVIGKTRGISAVRDLGCSISSFRLYIENQFKPGMSWDNHGEWHLDHVLPVSRFDLSDKSQQLEAFNWLNYQPLWAEENHIKSNK